MAATVCGPTTDTGRASAPWLSDHDMARNDLEPVVIIGIAGPP
jgi:hypothetical protein